MIKVIALVTFLIVGTVFLAGRYKIDGQETGVSLWATMEASCQPVCCP